MLRSERGRPKTLVFSKETLRFPGAELSSGCPAVQKHKPTNKLCINVDIRICRRSSALKRALTRSSTSQDLSQGRLDLSRGVSDARQGGPVSASEAQISARGKPTSQPGRPKPQPGRPRSQPGTLSSRPGKHTSEPGRARTLAFPGFQA